MSKRVVTYARVSTEDQAKHGYSLPSQKEACHKYAEERGWTVVAEISDDGVSGAVLDRPGLDRIRDMARAGEIDFVIVYDLDRLSRKAVYQMLVEEELGKNGVTIHYVLGNYGDDDEGRLQKHIRAAISEYEKAKILERMGRGKRAKARRGLVVGNGRTAYGYRYDGNGGLTIEEKEAHVVRLVFKWYTSADEEMSLRGIAGRLTAMKFRTHRGNTKWHRSTVAAILTNETYAGTLYYNRRNCQNPYSQRRVLRPEESWIPIPVPPIVDRETFEAAQRRLAHNRDMKRKQPRRRYLLSGMLACAECDRAYGGSFIDGRAYYRDRGKRHRRLRGPETEANVWEAIKEILLNPSALWKGYEARESAAAQHRARLTERLESILKLRAKAEARLEGLTNAYLDPDIGLRKPEYTRRRRQIEKEIADWEREAEGVRAGLEAQTISQERKEAIEEFAARVVEGIELVDFEEKRRILRLLEVRGKVHHDREEPWIELEGLFPPTQVGLSTKLSPNSSRLCTLSALRASA